jgi:general secretion pathway protein D
MACGALSLASAVRAQAPAAPAVPPAVTRTPITISPPTAENGDEFVDFTLHDGQLEAVLDALATYTGKTILPSGSLQATPGGFTIELKHMPKSEAITAIETLLTLHQFAAVKMGEKFLKIVPLTTAKTEAPEFIEGSTLGLPPSDKVATKLFQLSFLRVNELFTTLASMFTQQIGGSFIAVEKSNAVLMTDTISNLQRVENLIAAVDKPSSGGAPIFYPLHHAKASDLVSKIHALLSGEAGKRFATTTTFNSDDRTGQIIVICDPREQPFFDDLIPRLDADSASNIRTEVIYLKHALSKDLGTTIAAVISGQQAAAQKQNSGSATRPGDTPAAAPTAPGMPATPGTTGTLSGTAEFSTLMTSVSDERSNSIVVSGTVDDIRLMRELVEKLDAPLKQVRIEVIIAEVTLSDTDDSGITALGLTVGQSANGTTHLLNWAGTGSSGTSIAGWDFTSGVVSPLAFNAAMNATSAGGKSLAKVLSAQVIVTAHGKKAEAISGQQIPISGTTQSTPVSGSTGFATTGTTTYQNVDIDLTVTPLIGDNGDVQLTIDQKVNDLAGNQTVNGNLTPIIANREANSYVTVRDGEMIVLGGLQKTSKSSSQNKIGFLYEIPIISQLLGGHTDDTERTELLFFIRPHIIPTDDSTADTIRRIDEMSNKAQINEFLKDPKPKPDNKGQNFIDRFKSE